MDARLSELVRDELFRDAPPAARAYADELRRRHGDALAAVIFYGSCLRKGSDEGVLDFYALVDDYGAAYRKSWLARANAALPPNVFYLELDHAGRRLRAKYAVFSLRDFARAVQPAAVRTGTWARFCQPARVVYARDDGARASVVAAVCRAILTAVLRGVALLPGEGDARRVEPEPLWLGLFRETYASELRPDGGANVRTLYDADPARYAQALAAALPELVQEGALRGAEPDGGDAWRVSAPAGVLEATRRRARLRRPLAKAVATLQLLKSAMTFGDWLPYALWKLERHTGTRLEPTERQRRHPFVFGWPLIARVLWRKELR